MGHSPTCLDKPLEGYWTTVQLSSYSSLEKKIIIRGYEVKQRDGEERKKVQVTCNVCLALYSGAKHIHSVAETSWLMVFILDRSLLYLSAIQFSDFISHLNEKYSVIPILQCKLSRVTFYYISQPYHPHSNFLAVVWYGKAGFSCTWHKASSIPLKVQTALRNAKEKNTSLLSKQFQDLKEYR